MAGWRKTTGVRETKCGQRETSNLIRGQITQVLRAVIRNLNLVVRAMDEKHRKTLNKGL